MTDIRRPVLGWSVCLDRLAISAEESVTDIRGPVLGWSVCLDRLWQFLPRRVWRTSEDRSSDGVFVLTDCGDVCRIVC